MKQARNGVIGSGRDCGKVLRACLCFDNGVNHPPALTKYCQVEIDSLLSDLENIQEKPQLDIYVKSSDF